MRPPNWRWPATRACTSPPRPLGHGVRRVLARVDSGGLVSPRWSTPTAGEWRSPTPLIGPRMRPAIGARNTTDRGLRTGSGPRPRGHHRSRHGPRTGRPPAPAEWGYTGGAHPATAPRHHHRGQIGRQGGQRKRRPVGQKRRGLGVARRVPDLRRVPDPAPRGRRSGGPAPPFPNLRALNFVVVGLLGEGVASSTRPDPQAKGLGEYLRSRLVDIPVDLGPTMPERSLPRSKPWTSSNPTSTRCSGRR